MKYLMLLSTTPFALLTIISTGAVANEWKPIPPSEAKIVYYAPGLIGSGRFMKGSGPKASEQFGTWFAGPLYPRAQVYLQELHPNFVRRSQIRLERSLKAWDFLKGKNLDLGATKKATNVLGRVEYRQFVAEELHCVGFGQHFGVMHDSDLGTSATPPDYIGGYYCDTKPLTDDVVHAVIKALGVRGYKTPSGTPALAAPTANESGEKSAHDKSDRAICLGLPYGNPDSVKEAERRGLTENKCREILGQ